MKFGAEALVLMVEIVKIQDIDLLRIVRKGISLPQLRLTSAASIV